MFPSEHAVIWEGCLPLTEKSHQSFQSITVSNLLVYCRILTLVTVSSHLMTNEG